MYYLKKPLSSEIVGQFTLEELEGQLKGGLIAGDYGILECNGQTLRQLQVAKEWERIDNLLELRRKASSVELADRQAASPPSLEPVNQLATFAAIYTFVTRTASRQAATIVSILWCLFIMWLIPLVKSEIGTGGLREILTAESRSGKIVDVYSSGYTFRLDAPGVKTFVSLWDCVVAVVTSFIVFFVFGGKQIQVKQVIVGIVATLPFAGILIESYVSNGTIDPVCRLMLMGSFPIGIVVGKLYFLWSLSLRAETQNGLLAVLPSKRHAATDEDDWNLSNFFPSSQLPNGTMLIGIGK